MPVSLIHILLEQVAQGNARPAQLIDQAKPGEAIRYKDKWAVYRKLKPGEFEVQTGQGDKVFDTYQATNAVEAKLLAIDAMVEMARESLEGGDKAPGKKR